MGILHINSNNPSQLSQWLCCRTASIVVVIITVIISNSYNSKKYSLPPRCKDSQANWNTNILVAALLLPLLTPSVKAIWTSSNWRTPLTLECYRHRRLNTLTAWFSTHTSCNNTKQISPLIASLWYKNQQLLDCTGWWDGTASVVDRRPSEADIPKETGRRPLKIHTHTHTHLGFVLTQNTHMQQPLCVYRLSVWPPEALVCGDWVIGYLPTPNNNKQQHLYADSDSMQVSN